MKRLNYYLLKTVRITSWPLLLLVIGSMLTGYIMSGRFGLGMLLEEKTALAIHKALHLPLIVFLLAHSLAAMYLAFQRWGWIKK
ncbi:MAG: hypothetical protein AAB466_08925 [Verrucomicrobiota bacterium]